MFIGGLSWETTHDNLLRHFSRYGEVVDCVVMKNPETGRSRGFGFITFQDPNNVDLVLQNTPHILDSRTVRLKRFSFLLPLPFNLDFIGITVVMYD